MQVRTTQILVNNLYKWGVETMNTKYALPMVLAGSVMLSGCWLDDDDDPATTSVRVLHASSDAPAVNVRVNGDVVVPGADYKQAAVLAPSAGLADIAVDGLLPGGETVTVISADGVSLRSDTKYDVIAVGKVGDDTIEPLILADDGARDDANSARLRVVHLSPEAQTAAAGPVDVYVTASGDPLPAEATFSFSFKESVGPLELPASDDYQIRVTPAGSDTVVYDSGQIGLPAGSDLLVGAVDNTGANGDASPISLVVVNGSDVAEIFDVDQQSGVHGQPARGMCDRGGRPAGRGARRVGDGRDALVHVESPADVLDVRERERPLPAGSRQHDPAVRQQDAAVGPRGVVPLAAVAEGLEEPPARVRDLRFAGFHRHLTSGNATPLSSPCRGRF